MEIYRGGLYTYELVKITSGLYRLNVWRNWESVKYGAFRTREEIIDFIKWHNGGCMPTLIATDKEG